MTFLEQVLEHDRARAAGEDAPVPVTAGRKAVCVVCPELLNAAPGPARRLGLDDDAVLVVAVPAARVLRADGDVARAVALAAGACGGTLGGADVLVIGHEGCEFRSPVFAVPGAAPPGESFPTAGDLVRHSVQQLRASPWMARVQVAGAFVDSSGRLVAAGDVTAAAGVPAPMSAAGPVSFFGGSGAATSLAGAPPVPPAGMPPRPPAPAGVGGQASAGFSSPGSAGFSTPGAVVWDAPAAIGSLGSVAPVVSSGRPITMPTSPSMPGVGPLPEVSAPIPTVQEPLSFDLPAVGAPSPQPPRSLIDTPAPPPPPRPAPPQPAPPRRGGPPTPPPPRHEPPPPPRTTGPDDPFKRAEEILERLRKQRR